MKVPQRRPRSGLFVSWLYRRRFRPIRWFNRKLGRTRFTRCRYFGVRFSVDLEDEIGWYVAARSFEWRGIELLIAACRRIKPALFIDVGANLGVYSCVLARHGLVPRVLAFEPDRYNFARLLANIQLNRLDTVIDAREAAVGRQAGTAMLWPSPRINRGLARIEHGTADGFSVSVVSLDDVIDLAASVVALKIDVEGYENEVIAGATRLLQRNRGYAQIEALTDRAAEETTGHMTAMGWRLLEREGIDLRFDKV